MLYSKNILEDSETDKSCDHHSSFDGICLPENFVIIRLDEDMIKFCILKIALILKSVPR
jgi:hypothetical protein